jgi:hypothetical protein
LKTFLFTLLWLVGCGEPLPISLSSLRTDDEGDKVLVDEAVAILGLTWEPTRRSYGTISLTLVDDQGPDASDGVSTIRKARCRKAAIAVRDPVYVAHELYHVITGDRHVCEDAECDGQWEDNLMRGTNPLGVELTEGQYDALYQGRNRLTRCR